jgi:hypothetical protein
MHDLNGTATQAPPSADELLKLNGFLGFRGQILGIAQQAGAIQPEIFNAAIDYAETAKTRAELEGAPAQALDELDMQIRAMRAVRKLRQVLGRVDADIAARAKLRA